MKRPRRRCLRLAASGAALYLISAVSIALLGNAAWSQAPRTIRLVVPFAPGGGADILARLLADHIAQPPGPSMVVENRPGAGTVIATEAVARAVPDGNTLLIVGNSFVINPNLKRLNYDPLTSFEPICDLTRSPNVIVVNSTSPYRTLANLVNAARARPGELSMAFAGPATAQHIGFEMFKRVANVNLIPVPFSGAAPAVNALLGDHVTSLFVNYPSAAAQVKAGRLRMLAVASRRRIEALPDLPTIAESGFGGVEQEVWFGVVAPARTPREQISQLAGWFAAAVQAPAVKQKLAVQELYPVGRCGQDFAAHLRRQYDDYARIIREAHIRAE